MGLPNILAMGSGTKFDKVSAARLNNEDINYINFNNQILEKLLDPNIMNVYQENDDNSNSKKIKSYFRNHVERHLPGGFTYLCLNNQDGVSKLKCLHTTTKESVLTEVFKLLVWI